MNTLSDFYSSKAWEKFRQVVINERLNDKGFSVCEYCGKPIVKPYDVILHHKEELTEENFRDSLISLNPENIMIVHHKCHNYIHNKLSYRHRQVFIVWGSPLSGKSSYVDSVKVEGDLIIDIDNIWQCVSGCDRYVKPNRLKSIVFNVRDNLIEGVKYRRGKWNNCYLIGGYPLTNERERLIKELGAREIFIDTDKKTCIERLMNCEDRDKDEWLNYINNWWLQYEGKF